MIGKLTSVQKLDLNHCSNLLEISHEVSSLISLQHLDLSYNKFSSLPNSLFQLHQLTQLNLSYCTNLKSIPDLPLNIEYVYANDCRNLVNLPSNCSQLQFLTDLRLDNCSKLGSEGFTQVTGLRNLQQLYMRNCNVSGVSSRIGNLVSLRVLDLSENTFSSLPENFSNLSKLEFLDIDSCSELQLLPPLPSQLTKMDATYCRSLDVMPFDSMQKAYVFPSKVFKESLMYTKGLHIELSEEEVPEWCTYRNSGKVLSFVAPIQFDHSKICGVILCATKVKDAKDQKWFCPTIHNKTKGTSHRFHDYRNVWCSMMVNFYPLNDTTLVVEVGDTVELQFHDEVSGGLRLIYEDDVVDSGLLLKDVRKTTPSNSITQLNDEGAS